jgi:hypothetical protein
MPKLEDAGQLEQITQLYTELLQLFEEARQLQAQSTHLLAVARQGSSDVLRCILTLHHAHPPMRPSAPKKRWIAFSCCSLRAHSSGKSRL